MDYYYYYYMKVYGNTLIVHHTREDIEKSSIVPFSIV